jgi:hypothetical protein
MGMFTRGSGMLRRSIRIKGLALGWIVLAIIVVFGARVWSLYDDGLATFFQVTMRSSVNGKAVVYYDLGEGLSEKNCVQEVIEKGEDFSQYRFRLPNTRIHYLRFDPLSSEGHVEIKAISVTDGLGKSREEIAFSRITPIRQIAKFERTDKFISMDMDEKANDPQLLINFSKPVQYDGFLSDFYNRLIVEFLAVALAVILLSSWAIWEDRKQVKRWICRGVMTAGLAMVVFFFVQTCLAILQGSILPKGGGDTDVFIYLAQQKWTSPDFYHGLRPWTVPLLHSLVARTHNLRNLILLQVVISYASWIFLAFSASRLVKDDLLKAAAFLAIVCIPLNLFIREWNVTILSESLSFSFLAFFLGVFFWYFRSGSRASIIALAFVALLFAFVRDTDAYRVLFMAVPVLLIAIWHLRAKVRGTWRHAALFVSFLMIFLASNLSTSNTHYSGMDIPYTNARWYMPMMNNLFQRILPFEDRVKYFEDHGMPVTPALMAMKGKWASSNNWQSAFDPELASQRKWNYLHGRQTYMKYLLTYPAYTLQSAYIYRGSMLFFGDIQNTWYFEFKKPLNLRIPSPLFLNDERDVQMFVVLFPLAIILLGLVWIRRGKEDFGRQMHHTLLISYIILVTVPHAIMVFHGDLMDLPRHQYTNIVQLNIGIVLFYLLTADWWLTATRLFMKRDAV